MPAVDRMRVDIDDGAESGTCVVKSCGRALLVGYIGH